MRLIQGGINGIKKTKFIRNFLDKNKNKKLLYKEKKKEKDKIILDTITNNHLQGIDYNLKNIDYNTSRYKDDQYPLTSINNNSTFLHSTYTDEPLHTKGNCMCFIILVFFYFLSTILTNIKKEFLHKNNILNITNTGNETLTDNDIKNNDIKNNDIKNNDIKNNL